MPLGDGRHLRDVLSLPGVLALANADREVPLDVAGLAAGADPEALARVLDAVVAGLVAAFSAVILSVDPEIIVVTGRILPVVELALPRARAALAAALPSLPVMEVSELDGFSQPRGAVGVALAAARAALLDDVARA
jgi:predicted NBD/HSP70 family sugar kinase